MNIVLVGNCQTWPIKELFENHCPNVNVIGSIVVYTSSLDDEQKDLELLKNADVIVSQLITDTFAIEYIQTNHLKNLFPGKIVVIPNLFFHGQNPDQVYVNGMDRNRLVGPTDVYHSHSLISSYKAGHDVASINVDNYISRNFTAQDLLKRVESSFLDLESRESLADITMSDYLRDAWCDTYLFHTFNHPTIASLKAMVSRISSVLDIEFNNQGTDNHQVEDRLGGIKPPMDIGMSTAMGMTFKRPEKILGVPLTSELVRDLSKPNLAYSFEEYVELCYRCYDKQVAQMESMSYTPALAA